MFTNQVPIGQTFAILKKTLYVYEVLNQIPRQMRG